MDCGIYDYELNEGTKFVRSEYKKHTYIRHILKNFYSLDNPLMLSDNQDLHCVLIDIKRKLKEIHMTSRQKEILQDFMLGYTFQEIADKNGFSKAYADKVIKNICVKIQEELL